MGDEGGRVISIIIASALSALLSGALGYAIAMVRRDTKVALLEREHVLIKQQAAKIEKTLSVILRILIDVGRKTGLELRTGDVLELASLTPEE